MTNAEIARMIEAAREKLYQAESAVLHGRKLPAGGKLWDARQIINEVGPNLIPTWED